MNDKNQGVQPDIEQGQAQDEKSPACVSGLSREEFLKRLLKGAAGAGIILAAPIIVDRFLVPPAHAMASTPMILDMPT